MKQGSGNADRRSTSQRQRVMKDKTDWDLIPFKFAGSKNCHVVKNQDGSRHTFAPDGQYSSHCVMISG